MRRLATPAFHADAPRPASLLAPRRAARPGRQRPPAFARRDELPWAVLGKSPLLTTGRSSAEGHVGGRDALFDPSTDEAPSPPPSPPEPLARRLDLLMTAEDAVTNTYAYPNYPARFLEDVHLTRYIISEGKQPVQAGVRAVYAVLVKSDERNDAATDLEVSSTLLAPARTFRRWKAIVDTLRAESTDSATLLDLAGGPPVSAPPSPPASEAGDIEDLVDAFASLQPAHEGAARDTADAAAQAGADAIWDECAATPRVRTEQLS
jgi:hypothetical protein